MAPEAVVVFVDANWYPRREATVVAYLKAGTGGVNVRCRLTEESGVGEVGRSAWVTSTSWTQVVFDVTLSPGVCLYYLQLTSETSTSDLYCQSAGLYPRGFTL